LITAEGLRVATVKPVTSVGEMGVITGQPRSATVAAVQACRIIALSRAHFEGIFDDDASLRARVLRNFIQILADRVTDYNLHMRECESELRRFRGEALVLEIRILQEQKRVEATVDLLATQGDMPRDEATSTIDASAIEHTPTILVVDDEQDFRRLLRESLKHLSVVEASNGAQALSTMETLQPDLVITDIHMPGVNGLEL
jgi:CheY-like chemotaxis protein